MANDLGPRRDQKKEHHGGQGGCAAVEVGHETSTAVR